MRILDGLSVLLLIVVTSHGWAIEWEGASLIPRNPYSLGSQSSDRVLRNIEQIGANTVGINVAWFQDSLTSNAIAPDYETWSATDASIEHSIDTAHRLGMKVMLKPFVNVQPPEGGDPWRAKIQPTKPAAWFESYGNFVQHFADLAERKDVALFAIGTEMNGVEKYSDQWRSVIANIRQRYGGELTYSANFSPIELGDDPQVGGYQALEWWDDLDYVGMSAYFHLTSEENPTYEQIANGWQRNASDISNWLSDNEITQKVIFTEVGYNSHPDGASYHNTQPDARIDLGVQELVYQAMFNVLGDEEWFDGAFPWAWETDANAGGPNDNLLNVQNKPAEKVIASNYGGRHPVQYYPQLLASWERKLDEQIDGWMDIFPAELGEFDDKLELSDINVTHGSHSLAISSSGGPGESHKSAAARWNADNQLEQFSTLKNAFSQSDKFDLRMDLSFRAKDLPSDLSYFDTRIAVQGDSWAQTEPIAFTSSAQDADHSVSIPLSTFDAAIWNLDDLRSLEFHLTNYTSEGETVKYYVDNLRVVSNVPGDISNDGEMNSQDIDALMEAVNKEEYIDQFDVNEDGVLSKDDRDQWLSNVGWKLGDFDSNKVVNFADFLKFQVHFGNEGVGWNEGDFTGDAKVGFADFLEFARSYGSESESSATSMSVPEPNTQLMFVVAFGSVFLFRTRLRERYSQAQ